MNHLFTFCSVWWLRSAPAIRARTFIRLLHFPYFLLFVSDYRSVRGWWTRDALSYSRYFQRATWGADPRHAMRWLSCVQLVRQFSSLGTCFGRLIVGGVLIVVDVIKCKRGPPEDIPPYSKGRSGVCYQFRGDLVVWSGRAIVTQGTIPRDHQFTKRVCVFIRHIPIPTLRLGRTFAVKRRTSKDE